MTDDRPGGPPWSGLPQPLADLRRSESDRWLAGVAGGIARQFGIETWIVRLLVFALGVAGIGIPLYLLAWILVPSDERPAVAEERGWNRNTVIAICALVVIGSLVTFGPDDVAAPWRALPWILVALGAYLIFRAGRESSTEHATTTPTAAPVVVGDSGASPPAGRPTPPRAARPRRPRSYLTPITLFGLLALCGAAVLAGGDGWAEPTIVAAIAMCVIGAVLIVSSVVGRARGLVVIGVLLAVPLVAVAAAGPRWSEWGDRTYRVAEASQLRPSYDLGVGRTEFDLRAVRLDASTTTRLSIDQLAGQVVVWLPADSTTRLDAEVSVGEARVDGDEGIGDRDDLGRDVQEVLVSGDGDARFELEVELGVGELVIHTTQEGTR